MFCRFYKAVCLLIAIAGVPGLAAGDSGSANNTNGGGVVAKSSNTALARVAAGQGTKVVASGYPGAGSYELLAPSTQETVQFSLRAQDPKATLALEGISTPNDGISQSLPLKPGLNFFDLAVTAEDGKTQAHYEIKVIRACHTANWKRLVEHAPWIARDSAGELVFNGRMWLFGGYTPDVIGDVWSSADGANWQKHPDMPEGGVNVPVVFTYKGRMWVTTTTGAFFSSSDGEKWDLVTKHTPWGGGGFGVVFKDRMWVVGGFDGRHVWSSSDGKDWKLEQEQAPWSQRSLFGNVVAHAGRMWVIGGAWGNYQPFKAYTDVWSSEDGVNWTLVTDHAPWPARRWTCCVEYRNRIWLLGGFRGQPTWQNFDDVWYTANGKDWTQLRTEGIWSARHELSGYAHDGKLWVIAGNSWPLVNDVWQLDIPGIIFLTQPVLEEYAGAGYEYRAKADFNASCGPIKYRLTKAPAWLTVDGVSGVITGTPPAVGDFAVEVQAYDAAGETTSQSYTLHVVKL